MFSTISFNGSLRSTLPSVRPQRSIKPGVQESKDVCRFTGGDKKTSSTKAQDASDEWQHLGVDDPERRKRQNRLAQRKYRATQKLKNRRGSSSPGKTKVPTPTAESTNPFSLSDSMSHPQPTGFFNQNQNYGMPPQPTSPHTMSHPQPAGFNQNYGMPQYQQPTSPYTMSHPQPAGFNQGYEIPQQVMPPSTARHAQHGQDINLDYFEFPESTTPAPNSRPQPGFTPNQMSRNNTTKSSPRLSPPPQQSPFAPISDRALVNHFAQTNSLLPQAMQLEHENCVLAMRKLDPTSNLIQNYIKAMIAEYGKHNIKEEVLKLLIHNPK